MSLSETLRALAVQAARLEAQTLRLRGTHRLVSALYHPGQRQADYVSYVAPYHDGLIQIDTRSFIEWWIYIYGGFESGAIHLLRRLVHPGSVVMDVGANVGVFTLPLARAAGHDGHLYAFEPHPRVRKRLMENIALNNLGNVTVLDFALGAEKGEAVLYGASHANQGQASLVQRPGLEDQITCVIDTFDSYVQSLNVSRIDLIKIDTEGAEFQVLSGAREMLAKYRPCLYLEVSPDYLAQFGNSAKDVADLLSSLGYQIWRNECVETTPLQRSVKLRRLTDIGQYPARGLDFYWLAVHRDFVRIRQ